MPDLEYLFTCFLAAGFVLGVWSILLARAARFRRRASWGRWLFVLTLLSSAAATLSSALCCPRCLAPFGLLVGCLLVGMFWEVHPAAWETTPSAPEEI